jgi:phytoene dehydrogenase-like protein
VKGEEPLTEPWDAAVVGGGHNGLVCAAYLARAGLRVLVLERRDRVGGAATTEELAPGYRAPALAHEVGRLDRTVASDLGLLGRGLEVVVPPVRALALDPDGRSLALWADPGRTAEELRAWSSGDAEAFPAFDRRVRSLGSFLAHLHASTPPDLSRPGPADALAGLRLARAFRRLGPRAGRELLRVLPMPVADFVSDFLRTELLRAALAAGGIRYAAMGPRSAGTTAVLLAGAAAGGGAAGPLALARGGPGALAEFLAVAARSAGAEVRTGAEVTAILSEGGRAVGVALASGQEVRARAVVSGLDPKRTLLDLCDPAVLGPTVVWRARHLRMPGVVGKVNLALSGLPSFPGVGDGGLGRLAGRILVGPSLDYLERAFDASKYGRVSEEPFLEVTIPTLSDPSLAPEGGHVMSVVVQYAPYHLREATWEGERERLGDLVLKTLEAHAPGLGDLVVARRVVTPLDLERDYGLTEGHPLHGEPGLDQFFAWRPLWGWARYRMPLAGLYLCGSGAHPGGGITGVPGRNAAREVVADLRADRRRSGTE